MTELESIWTAIARIVGGYRAPDGTQYEPSRDAFSFELDPHAAGPVYYVDAPTVAESALYVGGGGASIASLGVWLSRDRGEDAQAVSLALANDAAAMQRRIAGEPSDWQVLPGSSVRVSAGGPGDVTVTGELRLSIDFEEAG